MKNKKGFIFIETILVITILSASLLALYSSYNHAITREKTRVYYDDPSYIYKSYIISKFLSENSDIKYYLTKSTPYFDKTSFTLTIGVESKNLFLNTTNGDTFENMTNFYHVKQVMILKPIFEEISKCPKNGTVKTCSTEDDTCKKCKTTFENLDEGLDKYIRSLGNVDFKNKNNYLFIIIYEESKDGKTCATGSECINYYTWLDSGVSYEEE